MKSAAAAVVCFALGTPAFAQDIVMPNPSTLSEAEIASVSPALARYGVEDLRALWARPQLSPRDRSVVTLAILVARNGAVELPHTLEAALDSGVAPREISEIITHLAFYSGWPNAIGAVAAAKDVFARRGIGVDQLPPATPDLLPLDEDGEAARVKAVEGLLGGASPGLSEFTTDPLFRDVWLRPDLSRRDRSLVTITALMANGQVAQLPGHLTRALDSGLTPEQAGEVVTQIAFYAGWPNAFSAGPVVKDVLAKRAAQ